MVQNPVDKIEESSQKSYKFSSESKFGRDPVEKTDKK